MVPKPTFEEAAESVGWMVMIFLPRVTTDFELIVVRTL